MAKKDSAKNDVMFHINNPDTPEESHINWMKQKKEEGWKWGPLKNPETKEHPFFTDYYNLPVEQRIKDYLKIFILKSIILKQCKT